MKSSAISFISAAIFILNHSSFSEKTSKKINIKKQDIYLNFPVTEANELKKTRIIIDGKVFDEFTVSLFESQPDYRAFSMFQIFGAKR